MGGMYGADVAQLRQLATQFERSAAQLDADRMSVGNAIQVSSWIGPVAVRFRHEWDSSHSRRVHDAALRLREAASALRRNADDQDKTSAADGRSGSSAGGRGGGSGTTPDLSSLPDEMRRQLQALIDAIREGKVGRVKPWELIGLLGKAASLKGVDMTFLKFFGAAFDGVDIVNKLIDGDPSVMFSASHALADLMGHAKDPVGKLVSLNLHAWTDVIEESSKADFSAATRERVGNYIVNNPAETIGIVGESVVEVGRRFVGWLPIP